MVWNSDVSTKNSIGDPIGGDDLYRAVVVDDEPFMLEGMRLMVDWQRCGFTLCGEARTAQEALHLVDTLQPHLLITDVRMPGILGTDLAVIVNRYHPEVLILFFSGYRDFSYAQSAIRSHAFGYLVKPIDAEEVKSTLLKIRAELDGRQAEAIRSNSQSPILRDQVFSRIACGDDSPESLLRAGVLMKLQPDDPCYCAVLRHRHGAMPHTARLVLSSFHAAIFELSPKEYGLAFRQIERDLSQLEWLMALFKDPEHFTLSVGNVYQGAHGFQKSLLEALDAQGALYESSGSLRLYQSFDASTAAWLEHARLPALRSALTHGGGKTLENEIAALCQAAAQNRPSLFALRCMAATLEAMLPVAASDPDAALSHPLWQQDAGERGPWLSAFCDHLRALQRAMLPEIENALPPAVLSTLAAVRTRYTQPLNLSQIAEEQHMNPAYLGQLVRKLTGATFHRQLLMTRIEHACLLLRQTAIPVGEIAQSVGFHDVDYFSQQFRIRMGMNPVAYRNAVVRKEVAHAPHQ
jgi:two-component system, response regulator YesN